MFPYWPNSEKQDSTWVSNLCPTEIVKGNICDRAGGRISFSWEGKPLPAINYFDQGTSFMLLIAEAAYTGYINVLVKTSTRFMPHGTKNLKQVTFIFISKPHMMHKHLSEQKKNKRRMFQMKKKKQQHGAKCAATSLYHM